MKNSLSWQILISLDEHLQMAGNVMLMSMQDLEVPEFIPDSDDEISEPTTVAVAAAALPVRTEEELKQYAIDLQARISTLQRQTRRPTREIVESCKELLTILGIAFFVF